VAPASASTSAPASGITAAATAALERELVRIREIARDRRAEDQSQIDRLTRELWELRATVARLRALGGASVRR
jgi:hypothetical protein